MENADLHAASQQEAQSPPQSREKTSHKSVSLVKTVRSESQLEAFLNSGATNESSKNKAANEDPASPSAGREPGKNDNGAAGRSSWLMFSTVFKGFSTDRRGKQQC